jgi:hypothetical protein
MSAYSGIVLAGGDAARVRALREQIDWELASA